MNRFRFYATMNLQKKRAYILRTLKILENDNLINSKSAIKLILSLSGELIQNCIALNLSKRITYLLCSEDPYFKNNISEKVFNKFFNSIYKKNKINVMNLEQKKELLKKIIITTSNNRRCTKNVISTFLDCFIPSIFSFIPYNLNTNQHSEIVFQYLKGLDPFIDNISKSTFFRWFQCVVKNQDSLKEQLIISDINTKNSAQSAVSMQTEQQYVSAPDHSIVMNQSSNNLQRSVTVAPNNDSLSTNSFNGATVTETINQEQEQKNTPALWTNPSSDTFVAAIADSDEKRKIDEYNKKRSLYCPKPLLPLVPLSPNDPLYPFDKKYEGFFYDQQGLIFDSLSKTEQTEWCPVPKILELNGSYPNMKSYKYRFIDKFNSIDVVSIYSNNLDSFVFEHFGDNSIQKCSFYMIKKEN